MKINCIAKSKMKDILLSIDDDIWIRSNINRTIYDDSTNGSVYLSYRGLSCVEYLSGTKCEIFFGFEI